MGDHNERVLKRLRTMDTESNAEQGPAQPQAQVEDAEAFEHIKQGSEPYDAQTYGTELRDPLPCSSSSVSAYADCVSARCCYKVILRGRGNDFSNEFPFNKNCADIQFGFEIKVSVAKCRVSVLRVLGLVKPFKYYW